MKQKTFRTYFSFLLLLSSIFYATPIFAQVTIGSGGIPNENALLDLKQEENLPSKKGLLLPRVELKTLSDPYPLTAHTRGMFVFNIVDVDTEIYTGCYYNTGTKWVRSAEASTTPSPATNDAVWFYLPVTPLNMTLSGTPTLDLYPIYQAQLEGPLGLTYTKDQIEFVLLGYDKNAFYIAQIGNQGVDTTTLIYRPKLSGITDTSYINIAIKIKKK